MAQFNGAIGDGYSNATLSSTTLNNTNLMVLYAGNNGDGYTDTILSSVTLNNVDLMVLYSGSNGDGYSDKLLSSITLNNTNLITLYSGSNGDGYANELLASTTLNNTNLIVMYSGNNGDGYADNTLTSTTLNNTNLIVMYTGSNGDGYADKLLYNTTLSNDNLAILYDGGNGDGFALNQENVFLNPNQIVDLRLNIKVLLQGPLITPEDIGLMNDILRENGLLPTISPYADAAILDPNVLNIGGLIGTGLPQDDIVDWVWIEIRSNVDNTNLIKSQSALLQRDGDVVALDGTSDLILEAVADDYFVITKHRNHLGVMTQNPITLSVTPTTIDFIDSNFPTFSSNAQIQLASGSMALWAGDANNSGQIKFSGSFNDSNSIKDLVLGDPLNGFNSVTFPSSGYLLQDINLDGLAKFSGSGNDSNFIKDNIFIHPSNGFGSPTFTIQSTVPPEN